MRLLYQFLVLLLFQLLQTKSSKASPTSSDTISPKAQLMRFYRAEFNLLAGEVCAKLQIISEKILNDVNIQNASTSLIQGFQKNLTHFQIIYPFYVRFGLNESLARVFSDLVQDYYVPKPFFTKDTVVIKQLLKEFGYDDLRQQYKVKFKNFYTIKFLSKFQQLKAQISDRSQMEIFQKRFSKCLENAQQCGEYECLLTNFRNNTVKSKDKFIGNLQRHTLDSSILVLQDMKIFYQNVLKHPTFLQLKAPLRQDLQRTSERSNDNFEIIDKFVVIFHLSANDVLEGFLSDHESDITAKQQRLITKIFEDCDYKKFLENSQQRYVEFIKNGFINEVENFRASAKQEGSTEDEPLLDMLETLDHSSSMREKAMAYMSLNIFEPAQLKKWRL